MASFSALTGHRYRHVPGPTKESLLARGLISHAEYYDVRYEYDIQTGTMWFKDELDKSENNVGSAQTMYGSKFCPGQIVVIVNRGVDPNWGNIPNNIGCTGVIQSNYGNGTYTVVLSGIGTFSYAEHSMEHYGVDPNAEYRKAAEESRSSREERDMFDSVKTYVKKHEEWIIPVIGVLLVDHFFFGGEFRGKIKKLLGGVLDRAHAVAAPESAAKEA